MVTPMYEDGKIRKTQIKDIRYAGYRQTFKIVLETGQSIIVTDNHKFPTQRGKVETKDLIVGEDYLFVNKCYMQENNFFWILFQPGGDGPSGVPSVGYTNAGRRGCRLLRG